MGWFCRNNGNNFPNTSKSDYMSTVMVLLFSIYWRWGWANDEPKRMSLKFSFNKKWSENVFAFHDNFMNIEKVFPRQLFSASCHVHMSCTYIEHVCFFSHTCFMCGSTALWKFKSTIGVESLDYLKQPLAKSWVNFVSNFSNLCGFHSHNL